jgi:hypothetical protein
LCPNNLEVDITGNIIYSANPTFKPGTNVMDYTDLTPEQLIDVFADAKYNKEQTSIKYMLFYHPAWHQRFANVYYLIETDAYLIVAEKIPSRVIHLTLPNKAYAMGGG